MCVCVCVRGVCVCVYVGGSGGTFRYPKTRIVNVHVLEIITGVSLLILQILYCLRRLGQVG